MYVSSVLQILIEIQLDFENILLVSFYFVWGCMWGNDSAFGGAKYIENTRPRFLEKLSKST